MKIAVLFSGNLSTVSLGGVDAYVKSLISMFEDYEITVIGICEAGEYILWKKYTRVIRGKKYYYIPICEANKRPYVKYYLMNEVKLLKILGQYDVIYAQRFEYSLPFIFSKLKKRLVQIIHGSSAYSINSYGKIVGNMHLILEHVSICIARKTYIILNREEYGVPYYQKRYKRQSSKIELAKNALDPDIYYEKDKHACRKKLGVDDFKFVVLYAGRVQNYPKRVFLFPQICKQLLNCGLEVCFVIVGDGRDLRQLKCIVEEMHLSKYFRFIGYVDNAETISDYNNVADVSINISHFEGTCTSNLESIACGTPVVSTDVGDIRECINQNCNGIIIPNDMDENIVNNAANAILKIHRTKPKMTNSYMKYSKYIVADEMRREFVKLGLI